LASAAALFDQSNVEQPAPPAGVRLGAVIIKKNLSNTQRLYDENNSNGGGGK
jgi:hypothetical protein